ncbi:MAG: undecaprenyl-diphosphatase UppP [Parcubacteria group bacterium CG1_02_58_44]|nr:MAG: undecaprenyl-diphosphatase UppP [Parcubacteria group bacterium CG1_02_58_44]
MDYLSGLLLGAVQGLTEFLPVSSSGHLILARTVFGLGSDHGLAVDAVLQLATILAVTVYFWSDLWRLAGSSFGLVLRRPVGREDRTLLYAIVVGTVPAAVLGLLLESYMETVFRSVWLVLVTLVLGAGLMWLAERFARQDRPLTVRSGLGIGLFQCLALVPGMSRSGSTISGGLFLGLNRAAATRFSFLLAWPIITASGLKKLLDLSSEGVLHEFGPGLMLGFAVAFAVGLAAIHFLIRFLRSHTLMAFVWYRLALAAVLAVMLLAG